MKLTTVTALLAVLALAAAPRTAAAQSKQDIEQAARKLIMAESAIATMYVDTVNCRTLTENAIRGMLEKLDPHSTYATPEEVKALNEPLKGNFEGIGVSFNVVDDTLLVISTIKKGPSERVGIEAGDRITAVGDTAIAGVKMPREEMVRRLRGPKGTHVKLTIVRHGIQKPLTFDVTRDKIPLNTVEASYMIRPGVGYIRVSSFGATTHAEFVNAAIALKKQGMERLILDLEENGGGYLQAAVDLAGEMLAKDDPIVYTQGRTNPRQDYRAEQNGLLADMPVTVLVDEYTASAAEIVSGAIQDNDRGTVVGRRTFGKGLVQRPLPLPDGSMIRLTTAHYYTPAGRCIQKPYTKGGGKDYSMDLLNRYKHGELTSPDSIHFVDSLRCYTLREHRVVYGGGGIMPDVFVPLDTAKYTKPHREMAARGIIVSQTLRHVDTHRRQLARQWKSFDDFKARYEAPAELLDAMEAEAAKQGVKFADEAERLRTRASAAAQAKALIARDVWDMSQYFAIWNEQSDIVRRALDQ